MCPVKIDTTCPVKIDILNIIIYINNITDTPTVDNWSVDNFKRRGASPSVFRFL